jgi:hypothetical protein
MEKEFGFRENRLNELLGLIKKYIKIDSFILGRLESAVRDS